MTEMNEEKRRQKKQSILAVLKNENADVDSVLLTLDNRTTVKLNLHDIRVYGYIFTIEIISLNFDIQLTLTLESIIEIRNTLKSENEVLYKESN